jgi:hypothetical protein
MAILTKTYTVVCANSTAQALDENVISISGAVVQVSITGLVTTLTPVTGQPGTNQIQFAGSVGSPSSGLTMNAAPPVNTLLIVKAVPAAGNQQGY